MTDKTVAIVGGGIAGLTAAHALRKRGFKVTVFEESVYLGGKLGAHRERLLGLRLSPEKAQDVDAALDSGSLRSLYGLLGESEEAAAAARAASAAAGRVVAGRGAAQRAPGDGAGGDVPPARSVFDRPPLERLDRAVRQKLRAEGGDAPTLFSSGYEVEAGAQIEPGPVEVGPGDLADPASGQAARAAAARRRKARMAPGGGTGQPQLQERWWRVRRPTGERPFNLVVSRYLRGSKVRYEITDDVYHEHCYHMFLGWYLNFWALLEDIGIDREASFEPRDRLTHLFPGREPMGNRMRTLDRAGSLGNAAQNLGSGAASIADLFLWMYSSVDLMSQKYERQRYLDFVSVNGFMASRWYATEDSAQFHEYLLVKAFAVPTYFSSAEGYRRYLAYTAADSGPMLYVLRGNTYDHLFSAIARSLTADDGNPVALQLGMRVTGLTVPGADADEQGISLSIIDSDIYRGVDDNGVLLNRRIAFDGEIVTTDAIEPPQPDPGASTFDCVILAVPPAALAHMLDGIRSSVPGLSGVRVLQSGSTAALDLYFKRELPDMPSEHVVCRGSKYGLTFIDNAQAWHDDENMRFEGTPITCLNVAATDFYKLDGMPKQAAMDAIIEDLKRFVDFEDADIDYAKTYLQMNQNEPLFLNEVGSEQWRPRTQTEIPNLFLAGDFCDNPVGVVCVEGAVVSGLMAARAVQAYVRDMPDVEVDSPLLTPIEILEPYTYPRANAEAMTVALAPVAAAAKAWSVAEDLAEAPERVLAPRALKGLTHDVLAAPAALGAGLLGATIESWKWWLRAASIGDDRDPS